MAVEVVDSTLARETGSEANSSTKDNAKMSQVMGHDEPTKFGSHGANESVKQEMKEAFDVNFPKDVADEWPEPKKTHSFFFVKYRSYEDQKLKAELDQAYNELHGKNKMRSQLIDKLRAKKSERGQVISHLKARNEENKHYRMRMDDKRKEMESLQQALAQLRGAGRDKRSGLCSSEEELNYVIKSLEHRIQHESIPLKEEKQILREIKQLEGNREKVIANAAMRAKIQESVGEKEALQDKVKLVGVGLDGVRKEQQVVRAKLKRLEEEKEVIDKEIKSLEKELTALTKKRDKTFENIEQLRKQREEGNSSFYENRSMLIKAKDLAAKKDVEALRDLSDTEGRKFISLWSNNKAFREDYEKRILRSLDMRQLSRDGTTRNPDEKPLLEVESTPIEAEVVARANVKQEEKNVGQAKEDSHPDASSIQISREEKNVKQRKEATNKKKGTAVIVKPTDDKDEEEQFVTEKLQNDRPKLSEVDDVKLKEMTREEEMAKARQAQERKKRLAEKASAIAAVKKQKVAEKREKKRENRLKKTTSSAAVTDPPEPEEQTKATTEVAELEEVEEAVETQAPAKIKDREQENVMRYRKQSKGGDSLPRVVLGRKKATNYWIWAAPAALAVVLLIKVGYKYLL